MSSVAQAQSNIRRWKADPVAFVRENFSCEPDAWQHGVLNALPTNMRLAMKACKGPGKTCLLAWVSWWFLSVHLHPKMAATSITADNLSDGLWAEMAKWQVRSPFLKAAFMWTKTRIFAKDHPETWFMSARSWSKGAAKEQQANTLAGLHADNIMFIIDEVGGIPDAVVAAAEAALANDHGDGVNCAKLLMAGNPTHLEGPLYRACTLERKLWHVTEITSDPDDPNRTPRVSKEWARQQIDKYGLDNPWVLVNVFGKFPPSSLNTLLGVDEVVEAMKRHHQPDVFNWSQKRLGIDVARFGDDRTVIFPRQGLQSFKPVEMRGARTPEIAARVVQAKARWGSEMEFVDGTGGWGAGVIDSLIQGGHAPMEVNFSGRALDPRYLNKRAEMWFMMAEWIKRGGALPDIPDLVKELTAPTYTFSSGKFQLEAKDQIKARLGFSPDYADSLALTFALQDMPAKDSVQSLREQGAGPRCRSDWNPFQGNEQPATGMRTDWDPFTD